MPALPINPTPSHPSGHATGLYLVETPAVETRVKDPRKEIEDATNFAVNDAECRTLAAEEMVRLAREVASLKAYHDPICDEKHAAWKMATAVRKEAVEPRETAKTIYGVKVAAFDLEEQKRAEERQRELMLAEQTRAEAEREASIEYLEQLGCPAEEVRALCLAPVVVAPVIAAPHVEKSPVSTRCVPKGRVTSLLAFVRHAALDGNEHLAELLEVNEGALNKLIAATGGKIRLPGVEIYQAPVVTTRKGGK